MSRRDLIFSLSGHLIVVLFLVFLSPISGELWGADQALPPLIFPVGLVEAPPAARRALATPQPSIHLPEPVADDLPKLEPLEKLEKEKLAAEPKPDSVVSQKDQPNKEDTSEVLAVAETDTLGKTGDLSHTVMDGSTPAGGDEIFGEYVPAIGYGATDPYFQTLFFAIQRSFRNPVPGPRPVRCVVIFTVTNAGEIEDLKLETSSGIARFDRAAVRAIKRIEWGRPFPKKFEDYDGYHIRMPFEYVPQ